MRYSHLMLLACGNFALLAGCEHFPELNKETGKETATPAELEQGLPAVEKLRKAGKASEAVSMLRGLQGEKPEDAAILQQLGYALIEAGQAEEAVVTFDKLIALNPKNAMAYNGKAVAFDHTGNHLAAQDLYQYASQLAPNQISIRNNLAMSLILNGQVDQAIVLLEKINREDEANKVVRQNLALAYGLKGENEKATSLNLQTLSKEQAEENLRFYELYDQTLKKRNVSVKPVSANVGFMETPAIIASQIDAAQKQEPQAQPVMLQTPKDTTALPAPLAGSGKAVEKPGDKKD